MAHQKYDAIIIGAGMSGIAAGIRLRMMGKKVIILEKHIIPGGLNSYYQRGKRKIDVGLHALTNFCKKGERGRPLTKLLRQLRIPYDQFQLCEQHSSLISFPGKKVHFSNDIEFLIQEIHQEFPQETDGFLKLLEKVKSFDDLALNQGFVSVRDVLPHYIKSPLLQNMLLCPLQIYGSAWENDMDFAQFVTMFKSIYLEGFSRPLGGVRSIIKVLFDKYEELGGEISYRAEVQGIQVKEGQVSGVLLKKGDFLETDTLFSSAGIAETRNLIPNKEESWPVAPKKGQLSFTESLVFTKESPKDCGQDNTIVFFCENEDFHYAKPDTLIDPNSGVLCFSNNFSQDDFEEGLARVTHLANFNLWCDLEKDVYKKEKQMVLDNGIRIIEDYAKGMTDSIEFHDVFTPRTIKKYTSHENGAVYGSIEKSRTGLTPLQGLYVCGTDQGFLGIVGSLLSGITISHLYGHGGE